MPETATRPRTGTWKLDPAHTFVRLWARHMGVARVRGRFESFRGTLEIADTIEESSVGVTIDADSLDTGVEDRDRHLKSADFLDVENHPNLEFSSTAVRQTGSGYEVDGDLTIRGDTRPLTLEVEFDGVVEDPWGNEKAIFTAEATIDREDWGLTWNQVLETGNLLVGRKVHIEIEAQAQPADQ